MRLKINYTAKQRIPMTRDAYQPVLTQIEATPLLIQRTVARTSLRTKYYSYIGVFEPPADALEVKEYMGAYGVVTDILQSENKHFKPHALPFDEHGFYYPVR